MSSPSSLWGRWVEGPYRLFMPLGILIAWAAVGQWILHGLGLLADYRSIFHSIAQIQGFLMCFALGFLLTMLPRRTRSAPATSAHLVVGVVGTVGTAVAAWFQMWAVSQLFWLAVAVMLIVFAARRVLGSELAKRRPPNSFVWLPVAIVIGVAGSILSGAGGYMASGPGHDHWWLHNLGRGLVLQGMFLGLVVGVGGLAFPLMTRGEPPSDATDSSRDRWARVGHGAAALLLVTSFYLEHAVDLQLAMLLRATVLLATLMLSARVYRLPSKPGLIRRMIWVGGWMVPLGYLLAAAVPEHHKAGLHVTFIGGFATLALAVGLQVILGHEGYEELRDGRPWQVWAIAGLVLAAVVPRALMVFDPERFFTWMVVAAALFVASTGIWMVFLLPRAWGEIAQQPSPKE